MTPTLLAVEGRVEDGYPGIPDACADLAIFSPPYFERDGWSLELMRALGRLMRRVLKPGGRAYMVFGQVQEGLLRPFDSVEHMLEGAADGQLVSWQTLIWVKSIAIGGWTEEMTCPNCATKVSREVERLTRGHQQPISSDHLVNYAFEYVFQFVRGAPKEACALDRLAIGVPYTDKSNLKRGTRGKNGDVRCAGDVLYVPYETTGPSKKKLHRHSFPLELATKLIKLGNAPAGGTIFDPFLGGGTTALAAQLLGLNAVGGDCDPQALDTVRSAWRAAGGREGSMRSHKPRATVLRPGVLYLK